MTEKNLLELSGVTIEARGRRILQGVDLVVQGGEIVTVIGPNGAGKTTLLKVALGLLAPSAGKVCRNPDLRIGYMPQRLAVDSTFPLTVRRFLAMTGRRNRARMQEVLAEVGAERLLDSPLHGLSGGELQRVLLARALLRDPDLLVLDEPVQGVDVHGQAELFGLITDIRDRRGCAILMVSHDLHLVMASTDRVVCLNGHVCCTGPPEAVARNEAFIALFGPQTVQSLAVYPHNRQHRHRD